MADVVTTAEDLVAHEKWEWRPRMRFIAKNGNACTVTKVRDPAQHALSVELAGEYGNGRGWYSPKGGTPDLTDAATGGIHLDMLREVWCTVACTRWAEAVEYVDRVHLRLFDWEGGRPHPAFTTTAQTLGEAAGKAWLFAQKKLRAPTLGDVLS